LKEKGFHDKDIAQDCMRAESYHFLGGFR